MPAVSCELAAGWQESMPAARNEYTNRKHTDGGKKDDMLVNYNYYTVMLHMHEVIKKIIRKVGKEPLCNGKPERAPHIFGKCFILCWRCTSLIFSMLLCSCLCYFLTGSIYIDLGIQGVICAVILAVPTLVDGVLQYIFHMESTNTRRILLGCVSGIGLWMLASWMDLSAQEIWQGSFHGLFS